MSKKLKIFALITARSGSKSVKNKNIRNLEGYPIIAYSIIAAKLAGIKRTIISTDSNKYAKISKKYGGEVPFLRPKNFSKDSSLDFEPINHAIKWIQRYEKILPDFIVHLRPTTPLRDPMVIKNVIKKFLKMQKKICSLRSAHIMVESPLKYCHRNKKGLFVGINKNSTPHSISFPKESYQTGYIPNGYIDIIKVKEVLKKKRLYGKKMYIYITPQGMEIDSKEDLEYISYQAKKKKFKILNYLKKNIRHTNTKRDLQKS